MNRSAEDDTSRTDEDASRSSTVSNLCECENVCWLLSELSADVSITRAYSATKPVGKGNGYFPFLSAL